MGVVAAIAQNRRHRQNLGQKIAPSYLRAIHFLRTDHRLIGVRPISRLT